jgi:hypothetical protein
LILKGFPAQWLTVTSIRSLLIGNLGLRSPWRRTSFRNEVSGIMALPQFGCGGSEPCGQKDGHTDDDECQRYYGVDHRYKSIAQKARIFTSPIWHPKPNQREAENKRTDANDNFGCQLHIPSLLRPRAAIPLRAKTGSHDLHHYLHFQPSAATL